MVLDETCQRLREGRLRALSMNQRALVVSGIDRSSRVVVHWLKRRWASVGRFRLVRVARYGGVASQPMANPKFADGME